jgi:hypothetical protein
MKLGDRFGRLRVVRSDFKNSRGRSCLLLKCDCGNECIKPSAHIIRGNTKSCGCLRNSTGIPSTSPGDRFGCWTAVSFVSRDKRGTNQRWRLRCDCGNERVLIVSGKKYRGAQQSCGCTRKPTKEKLRIDLIYKTVRRGSVKREIPFNITKSDIQRLAEDQQWKCSRTGIDLDLTLGDGRKPFGPTIDRIDNSLGYEPSNIQLVCNLYNYCKNEHTDSDVLTFASALVAHAQKVKQLKRAA